MLTMSSTENTNQILLPEMTPEGLKEWFDKRFTQSMAEYKASKPTKLSIMVTKGTLDWAYPSFTLLKKDFEPQITPLGNPAMPMKMPFGPDWFQNIEWNMPNLVMAGVPGFESLATSLMKKTLSNHGVVDIAELRTLCIEAEAKLVACQMTVDLFGWKKEDFIPEIADWAGAASYLDSAQDADVTLFI
jgi:peroxiredoxin family protein